ncbi:MAG TPA: HAD family hydrolase [Candidatus Latescibacteria bacterium]|nr:HAD family hydrolase [Candidatus Latescibacterota bacterium]
MIDSNHMGMGNLVQEEEMVSTQDRRRLVLFDVDGTILNSGGAGRRAIKRALIEVFGTTGSADSFPFAGKTDPQIILELMTGEGLPEELIRRKLGTFFKVYIRNLEEEIPVARKQLYPGVRELLSNLSDMAQTILGLLTGNIREGAEIKLKAFDLNNYFQIGAYGDDSEDRYKLPQIAISRTAEKFGRSFWGKEVVIVGDTPHDINCGKAVEAKSVAVATGWTSLDELKNHKPDYIFEDFSDYEKVIEAILA